MYKFLTWVKDRPLKLTSIILPLLTIPTTLYCQNYFLLYTEIPLGITTILFHQDFFVKYVKYIRSIDIICCFVATAQHIPVSYFYIKNSNTTLCILFTGLPLYILGKKLEWDDKLYKSIVVHSIMHLVLTIGVILLNISI